MPKPLLFDKRLNNNILTINNENLLLIRKLGAGWKGTVFLAENAKKQLICIKKETSKKRAELEAEAITHVYGHPTKVVQKGNRYYFTMPYFEGNTLKIQQQLGMTLYEKIIIAEKLRKELHKLHQYGYLHRDITANNIIVNIMGADITVKIIDLGRSVPLKEKQNLSLDESKFVMFFERHTAPEHIYGGTVGKHSDIYSFGKIFVRLFPECKAAVSLLTSQDTHHRDYYFSELSKELEEIFKQEIKTIEKECNAYLHRIKDSDSDKEVKEKAKESITSLKEAILQIDYRKKDSILAFQREYIKSKNTFKYLEGIEKPHTLWQHIKRFFNLFGITKPILTELLSTEKVGKLFRLPANKSPLDPIKPDHLDTKHENKR